MEPFGLLNFLKSVFDATPLSQPQASEKSPPNTDKDTCDDVKASPVSRADARKDNPISEKTEGKDSLSLPENTCAEFIRRHDERAGRIRKK